MPDQSANPTAIEEWNFPTLKAFIEQQIGNLRSETDLKFTAAEAARKHQYVIDQEHFTALNSEAARILRATEITVSRDTWDGFLTGDRKWKSEVDIAIRATVSATEFQTYKDTLTRELAAKSAQAAVVTRVALIFGGLASLAVIANVFWNVLKP
jgi:hypothetical protein